MSRSSFCPRLALTSCPLVALLAVASPASGQCSSDTTDCNANGIPDACELSGFITVHSGRMSPFDAANAQYYTLTNPPEVLDDLVVRFNASGDLANWTERVDVWINETPVQSIFLFAVDCADTSQAFLLPKSFYDEAAATGSLTIYMAPSYAVDPGFCSDSYVDVELDMVTYPAADENGNGVLDECEQNTATMCEGLEPTIYVDDDGFVVGGPLDGKPYFGVLVGTPGDDVMMGTEGDDLIVGAAGDDTVCGNGGDDHVTREPQGRANGQSNGRARGK